MESYCYPIFLRRLHGIVDNIGSTWNHFSIVTNFFSHYSIVPNFWSKPSDFLFTIWLSKIAMDNPFFIDRGFEIYFQGKSSVTG